MIVPVPFLHCIQPGIPTQAMVLPYLGLLFLISYPKLDNPLQLLLEADLNLYSHLQIFLGTCFLEVSLSLQIHNTHHYNARLSSQDPSPAFSSLRIPIVIIIIYLSVFLCLPSHPVCLCVCAVQRTPLVSSSGAIHLALLRVSHWLGASLSILCWLLGELEGSLCLCRHSSGIVDARHRIVSFFQPGPEKRTRILTSHLHGKYFTISTALFIYLFFFRQNLIIWT